MMNRIFVSLLVACCLAGPSRAAEAADAEAVKRAMVLHHAKMIHANYSDCVVASRRMQAAIREFLAAPDAVRLEAARKAWIEARRPYLQSEAYRFYAGPIDDADGPEPMLNSWPLDENYIDAPPGSVEPGIVGDVRAYPRITQEMIARLNQTDGEKNVTCGWHAVEFLLWGQDHSATGPGDRPPTDYTTAPNATRRGQYLQGCADLIVQQLEELTAEWAPGELGNYRAVFEEGIDFSVERIVTGLIFLSENELAGERLAVAWETKDQENEHSCFSDTTQQDGVMDATGVQNVWRGVYVKLDGTRVEGTGLRDLCRAVQPDMESKLGALIDGALEKAKRVPQPFDQAILGDDDAPGRKAVLALLTAFEDQAAELRTLARALKIEVPEQPPEDVEG